jgi:hypothetical protein
MSQQKAVDVVTGLVTEWQCSFDVCLNMFVRELLAVFYIQLNPDLMYVRADW